MGTGASAAPNANDACWINDLPISFAPDVYSAYIEGSNHAFQFPLLAQVLSGTAQWTASDPSAVRIDPNDTSGDSVTITVERAGDVVIKANAAGRCGTTTLHVTAATEAEWQAGNARYNDMNPLPKIQTDDGGVPVNFMGLVLDPPAKPPACTNCHGQYATSSIFRTATFIPYQTAGYSDQELIDMITRGDLPIEPLNDPIIPMAVLKFFHTWSDITGEEAKGVVVYLRSLLPMTGGTDITRFIPPRKPHDAGAADAADAAHD
jgi:hypothetical protein